MTQKFIDLSRISMGVATSSLQIEGGDRNNNWYDWATTNDVIRDGSNPLRSTDHWNRWREDTELMSSLGLQTYRMSIEWSRIEPQAGVFSQEAMNRYREEIILLQEKGIHPLVSLHHFSHPSWFQGLGEWTNSQSPRLWLKFVEYVVTNLSDLVTDWVTINEPNVYASQCYLFREGPPAEASICKVRKVLRHMAIAHCRAYKLIHELQPQARVTFAHHLRVFDPLNPKNPLHRSFAYINSKAFQNDLTHAFLGGKFSAFLGGKAPADITPGKYYDVLGINYYSRTATRKIGDGTFPGTPINDLGWEIYAEGLIRVARELHEQYPGAIWVTENGTCDNGDPHNPGTENFRSRYIADHLIAMEQSGLPFERYYHWCFVDNWEWIDGEVARFGLVHNDYETQVRTVKPSGKFLAQIIADGGITPAAYDNYVAAQQYYLG